MIRSEYVFLYITENSLTATLKSFSADSIWVISQLDSFQWFFPSVSDWFTFSCFFVIMGHILDIGNAMLQRLRILANFSPPKKMSFVCSFILTGNYPIAQLQTSLQHQLKSHFSSLFLTWLLATYPSNWDHVLAQVGQRKQNFFLSLSPSPSLHFLAAMLL